jgi:hypothetical protein
MRTGTVASAICAARNRRAPTTISKLRSFSGRTSKGERTPWVGSQSPWPFNASAFKITYYLTDGPNNEVPIGRRTIHFKHARRKAMSGGSGLPYFVGVPDGI